MPGRVARAASAVAALASMLVLAQPVVSAPASAADTIGGSGAGDSYFPRYGNGGYDVRRYAIRTGYDAATAVLSGTTRIRARASQRLTRFNLDLVVRASDVRVDGRPAKFRQTGRELIVTPRRALGRGRAFTVRVVYRGRPSTVRRKGVKPFLATSRGAVAVGQPEIAAWWFPSNDHPRDKARFDIRLRATKGRQAISNGRLVGKRRHGATTTWHWRSGSPMATYLAFAVWGDYDLVKGRTNAGKRYLYAYDADLDRGTGRRARASLRKTGRVTEFLERIWGRYPFAQIGGVVTAAPLGYALENQTRPVYDGDFFRAGTDTGVVVHEMAHQWFGDAVTIRRWRDIWLSEGFATYSQWLWTESRGGRTANRAFAQTYASWPAYAGFWRVPVRDPGPKRIFHPAVYDRGAMALHALRRKVGDDTFFRIGRAWASQRGGVGSTGEFVDLAERISRRQLDAFFRTWLSTEVRPRL